MNSVVVGFGYLEFHCPLRPHQILVYSTHFLLGIWLSLSIPFCYNGLMAQSQLRPWRWGMILWYQLFVNYLCLGQKQFVTREKSDFSWWFGPLAVPHCRTASSFGWLQSLLLCSCAMGVAVLQSWGWHCPSQNSHHFLNANVFNICVGDLETYRLCNEVIIGLVLKISVAQSYAIFYYGNVEKYPFLPRSHNFSQQSPVCFTKIAAK